MRNETIILSVEISQIKSWFSIIPGRSIYSWRIDKSTKQELYIHEIYDGKKEWIYSKFGYYRNVSKI